ncbi:MAG: S-layer homology domain-containing protein, partial [Oscillibacter sp.]|nr:S-layer homology domain-containing protein [Oscillibacter sp.]
GEISQNATITREEMCVVLAKMLKVAASEKDSIFPDTDNAYVMALVELGIIDGIDGSFQPDGPLTRAQVCKILATIPEDLETAGDEAEAPAESEEAPETDEGETETEPEEKAA